MAPQRTSGLDVARGSLETSGAFVEMAVDVDMAKLPALKAGLVIAGVVTGKRCVMVTTSPPDFCVSDGNLFLFS